MKGRAMKAAVATAGVALKEPFSRLGSRSSKLIRRRFSWRGGRGPSQFFLTCFNEPINAHPPIHPPPTQVPHPPPHATDKLHPYPTLSALIRSERIETDKGGTESASRIRL